MWHALKRHPFPIEAHFDFTLALTFSVPAERLRPFLHPGLELDTYHGDTGFLAITLVQTRDLRPGLFPAALGQSFFLTGYRIFVRRRTASGRNLHGLQVLRSEANRRMMCLLGNALTHYQYHHAHVEMRREGQDLDIAVDSSDGKADLLVRVQLDGGGLPEHSIFSDERAARRFAGPMPFTFSYEPETESLVHIEGERANWHPHLVEAEVVEAGFLSHLGLDGDAHLASAFYLEDVPYRWSRGVVEPAFVETDPVRHPLQGTTNVVRFNWPSYVAAAGVTAIGSWMAANRKLPCAWRLLGGAAALGSVWQTAASLAATHWVYDRSGLYSLDWLEGLWPENPHCILNVHAGFDETTARLRTLYPSAKIHIFDFFDPERNPEPCVARARASHPPVVGTRRVGCENWPIKDEAADAILIFLAAHEMRDPEDRRRLFAELRRVCAPDGRIVIVEHLQDAANLLAYGPGFFHFLPRHVWVEEPAEDLFLVGELSLTPFLRVFCYEPQP
jgi:SAM-dependent methyltransferase